MAVYVEYIFISNWLINYLIIQSVFSILKIKMVKRSILSSFVGGIMTVIFLLVSKFELIFKLLTSTLMVLIAKKHKSGRDFFYTYTVFMVISFVFAGSALMSIDYAKDKFGFTDQRNLIPMLLAVGMTIARFLIAKLVNILNKFRQKIGMLYKVEIQYNDIIKTVKGFYDSGNKLKEGAIPVIAISKKLANTLVIKNDGDIVVRTVTGTKILSTASAKIKIYFNDDMNKIYYVKCIVSENLSYKYDVLLNSDMVI